MNSEVFGNKLKAAIFDIDGTLLDSMPMWSDVCARYLISIGVVPEPDLSEKVFTMTLKEGCEYTKAHYDLSLSVDEIEEGIKSLIENFYYNEVLLKPGVKKFVEKLDSGKIPMVLATTGDEELASSALKRNGILKYFKKLYACGDYDTSKREKYIFMLAKSTLEEAAGTKLKCHEIGVFEDSLTAIKTAKETGFFVVGILDEESKDSWNEIKEIADCFYYSFEEI